MAESGVVNMEIKCELDSITIEDVFSESEPAVLTESNEQIVENNDSETNSSSKVEIQYSIDSALECDGENIKIENMSEVKSELKYDFNSVNGSVAQHLEPSENVTDDGLKSHSELKYEIESVIGLDFVSPIKSETSEFNDYDCSEENNCTVSTPFVVEEIVDIIKVEINHSSEYCEENNNDTETNLNSETTLSNEINNEKEDDLREAEEENYEREEKIQRLMLIDTQELLAEKQSEEEPQRDESAPKEEGKNIIKCYDEGEVLDLIPTWRNKQLEEEYYLQEERRQRLKFWDYVGTDFLPNVSEIGRKRTANSENGVEVSCKKLRS